MTTPLAVALIAGGFSIIAALISLLANRSVEALKATLAQESAKVGARQDYEYEALKRLYSESEPVRFQLLEAAERASEFIEGLARRSRVPDVPGSLPRGNYLQLATIYHLLLPAAIHRSYQRRLTLVDLRISAELHLSYLISRQIYRVFAQDAEIAAVSGIQYTPYVDGWREKRIRDSHRFRRQGFALGRLDNALDELVTRDPTGHERPISFGEFEQRIEDVEESDYRSPLGAARDMFLDFEVETRPVLWRILVVQYLLYDLLFFVRDTVPLDWGELKERLAQTEKAKVSILNAESESGYTSPSKAALLFLTEHFLSSFNALGYMSPPNQATTAHTSRRNAPTQVAE